MTNKNIFQTITRIFKKQKYQEIIKYLSRPPFTSFFVYKHFIRNTKSLHLVFKGREKIR